MNDLTERQYWCAKCEIYWTEPHCSKCGQVILPSPESAAPPSVRSGEWVGELEAALRSTQKTLDSGWQHMTGDEISEIEYVRNTLRDIIEARRSRSSTD